MKKGITIYLLYVLLNVTVNTITTSSCYVTSGYSTFLSTAPFIAGGDMLGATMANGNFRRELQQCDLTNRSIGPGEAGDGLVSLREFSVDPLRLELSLIATTTPSPLRLRYRQQAHLNLLPTGSPTLGRA